MLLPQTFFGVYQTHPLFPLPCFFLFTTIMFVNDLSFFFSLSMDDKVLLLFCFSFRRRQSNDLNKGFFV